MIDCGICESEVSADQETAYAAGRIFHLSCLDEFDGDLEDLL